MRGFVVISSIGGIWGRNLFLMKTISSGHTEIVKHLVEHGADVNICSDKNDNPLYLASENGHTEIVKNLVEHSADVNICRDENVTPLYIASGNGHTEIVKLC
jgi:serine/threonine-protein phosphatase 6 regulatory ankyrin repeat subunit B